MADTDLLKFGCLPGNISICRAISWVLNVAPITIFVFGVTGNMLSFTVLSRKQIRTKSSFLYLRFICIFDSLFLTAAMSRLIALAYFRVDMNAISSPFCKPIVMVGLCSQATSMYMIALMCVERVIYITIPFRAKEILTNRRAVVAILCIMAVVVAFQASIVFGLQSENQQTNSTMVSDKQINNFTMESENQVTNFTVTTVNQMNDSTLTSENQATNLTLKPDNETSNNSILESESPVTYSALYNVHPKCVDVAVGTDSYRWHMVSLIVNSGIPVILIITCNAILIRKLLVRSEGTMTESRSAARNSASRIAITITVFYFVTQIPYFAARLFFLPSETVDENYAQTRLIALALDLWSFGNYSCNFLLYFCTGSNFKTEFRALMGEIFALCCPCRRGPRNNQTPATSNK